MDKSACIHGLSVTIQILTLGDTDTDRLGGICESIRAIAYMEGMLKF